MRSSSVESEQHHLLQRDPSHRLIRHMMNGSPRGSRSRSTSEEILVSDRDSPSCRLPSSHLRTSTEIESSNEEIINGRYPPFLHSARKEPCPHPSAVARFLSPKSSSVARPESARHWPDHLGIPLQPNCSRRSTNRKEHARLVIS